MPSRKKDIVFVCRLKQERMNRALSLDDVAKLTGVSKQSLWQIQNGTDPMLSTAIRIANGLNLEIDYLWPERLKVTKKGAKKK